MTTNLSALSSSSKYGTNSTKRPKIGIQSLKSGESFKNRGLQDDRGGLTNQSSLPMLAITVTKVPLSPRKSQSQQQTNSPGPQKLIGTSMDDLSLNENRENIEITDKLSFSLEAFPSSSRLASHSGSIKRNPSRSTKTMLFPQIHTRNNSNLALSASREEAPSCETIVEGGGSLSKKLKKQRSVNVNSRDRVYRYKICPGNNSRCLMNAMKKRPWWHAIITKPDDDKDSATGSSNNNNNNEEEELLQHQPSFIWEMYRNSIRYKQPSSYKNILLNHIQKNAHLVTKKGLYLSIKSYCQQNNIDMLSIIPLSFYLAPGEQSKSMKDDDLTEFQTFCERYSKDENCHVNEINFIMKPASKTNRGFGIKVVKGMSKVLSIVQRGLSACSTTDDTPDGCGGKNGTCGIASLENSFSADESVTADEGNISARPSKEPATTTTTVTSPTSHKREKVKKANSSKAGSSSNTTTNNSSSNNTNATSKENQIGSDAVENNPLTKAAKKIAQQDGYIVQLYLNSPLLIHGRKFDIRCFVLATVNPDPSSTNGEKVLKAYFFQDAYIRTSSKKYNLSNLYDREIHLTNDAIQKHSSSYGKYESGNKLSLQDWQEIINEDISKNEGNAVPRAGQSTENIVFDYIFPEIKRLCKLSIAAVAKSFQTTDIPKSFELFGYDFMILTNFQPILIEVNTNPCLEFVNPLLTGIISSVIEQTIRLTVDKEFPPPSKSQRTRASEEAIQLIEAEPIKFEPLYP